MSRAKKQPPSKGKKGGDESVTAPDAAKGVLDGSVGAVAAAAEAPDSPSNFFEDDAKPKADEEGGEDEEEAEEASEGDENRKVAAVGAKKGAAAKKKKGGEDDLSETAAALAAVGGNKPAAKRTTRSSTNRAKPTGPASPTALLEVDHDVFPGDRAAFTPTKTAYNAGNTPDRSFMSTLGSGGSRPSMVRKVARKKIAAAAAASKPSADVKRKLKTSVVGSGNRKPGAARARPSKSRVLGATAKSKASPGRKRAAAADTDDDDSDFGAPPPVKISKREEEPYWFGKPDDKLNVEFAGFQWPKGWTKELIQRKSGKTAGTLDAYWYSPGRKLRFRSKAELQRFFNAIVNDVDEATAYRDAIRPPK